MPAGIRRFFYFIDKLFIYYDNFVMAQTTIQLSNEIMLEASKYSSVYTRSLSMQIEHWARIGKIAEENPDLTYAFIEDVLIGKAELDNGNVTPFEFRQS